MTTPALIQFFSDRPAISKAMLCQEAGITRQYLNAIIRGDRPLTEEAVVKLLPVMKRYGYLSSD